MREAYPVIITKTEDGFYYVSIPDFEIASQGKDIPDAIYMARDAIGIMGIDLEDSGKELPKPNTVQYTVDKDSDIVTWVDVDFTDYRCRLENKAVKKNCTIPYRLNEEAEKAGINFSKVLQDALTNILYKAK